MTSNAKSILNLLEKDSIYDRIFGHLSPASIHRVAQTCRGIADAVGKYKACAFDIDKHLQRFFTDPLSFRILQAETGALVSGSNALQFLDRVVYPGSDLDLFVSVKHAAEVCEWIVVHGGSDYQFSPSEKQKAEGIHNVNSAIGHHETRVGKLNYGEFYADFKGEKDGSKRASDVFEGANDNSGRVIDAPEGVYDNPYCYATVINFISTKSGMECKKVQVVLTSSTPMASILNFHSTVVMNVLTYRAAYSLFPLETFEERRMFAFEKPHDITAGKSINKYILRGWQMVKPMYFSGWGTKLPPYEYGRRWVSDDRSWILPFDISKLKNKLGSRDYRMPVEIDPFSLNSFNVTFTDNKVFLDFDMINACFLQDSYTSCKEIGTKLEEVTNWILQVLAGAPMVSLSPSDDTSLFVWNQICMKNCRCQHVLTHDAFLHELESRHGNVQDCPASKMLMATAGLVFDVNVVY